jgi:O-antigen/teichoic acid export membrane protein
MRTKNSIYNFITSYIPHVILALLGFVRINLFLNYLGENIFALNQLYINIFAYLAVTEAGTGLAFVYRLYHPLAFKKHREINSLYSGSKEIFKKIGIYIIALGFIISFIIPSLIRENIFSNVFIQFTFMLFIIKNAIDYFMFTPRFVIQADQKLYKTNLLFNLFRFFEIIAEIILLLAGVNYIIILVPGVFIRFFQNHFVNKRIFKLYPWLREVKQKDYSTKKDVKHLLAHKFVGLISNNIDIVILSSFLGSTAVAIYAGYNYLVRFAIDTIRELVNATKESFGNILQVEEITKIREIFDELFILFSYIGAILVIIFYFVIDDFIAIWLGRDYIISTFGLSLFLIILYYYITSRSAFIIKDVMGLFKETKVMSSIEASINLLFSLIFVNFFGLEGVLLATVVAFTFTNLWYYPYLINKVLLKENLGPYVTKWLLNIMIILFTIYLLRPIYNNIHINILDKSLLNWFINTVIISILVISIISLVYAVFYRTYRVIIIRLYDFLKGKAYKK